VGVCLSGACLCPGDHYGPTCARAVCPGSCNGNGKCVVESGKPRCECAAGYRGIDCALADVCEGGCSSRGRCLRRLGHGARATCACDPGFAGASCETTVCASGCSGHGTCKDGKCWCEPGYSGATCAWKRCLFDCSGNGVCDGRGACLCDRGWRGFDCSLPDDGPPVTQSCAAHCLGAPRRARTLPDACASASPSPRVTSFSARADECEGHCELVAEFMGSHSADECLMRCTEACVPACAESAARTLSSGEAPGGESSASELASELLQERVPDATALVEAL
jgi:hypothetical protein